MQKIEFEASDNDLKMWSEEDSSNDITDFDSPSK